MNFMIPPTQRPRCPAVELADDNNEKKQYEELANLYAIIKATEALEGAFSRDLISAPEYTAQCDILISNFKSTEKAMIDSKAITSTEAFVQEYNMKCPRAVERLMRTGTPATTFFSNHNGDTVVIVAETVQEFITCMDIIQLEQRAVDEIQPALSKVLLSLSRVPGLPTEFEGRIKLTKWLEKLHALRAHNEIDESDARQLKLDLENSYAAFHAFIKSLAGPPSSSSGGNSAR